MAIIYISGWRCTKPSLAGVPLGLARVSPFVIVVCTVCVMHTFILFYGFPLRVFVPY